MCAGRIDNLTRKGETRCMVGVTREATETAMWRSLLAWPTSLDAAGRPKPRRSDDSMGQFRP